MRRVLMVSMVSMAGWALGVFLAQRASRDRQATQVRQAVRGIQGSRERLARQAQQDRLDPQVWRERAARMGSPDHPVHLAPSVTQARRAKPVRLAQWDPLGRPDHRDPSAPSGST